MRSGFRLRFDHDIPMTVKILGETPPALPLASTTLKTSLVPKEQVKFCLIVEKANAPTG
jgi:hypothetical protein